MKSDELRALLKTLHQALSEVEDVDDATRLQLAGLTDDIDKILDEERPEQAEEDSSLSAQLRDALIEFEVRHPQIGGILERLTSGLSNMGI